MKEKEDSTVRNLRKKRWNIVLLPNKTVKEVAQDLGTTYSNLRRWRSEYSKRGEMAFPGDGREKLTSQEEKLKKLQKELNDTRF